MSTGAIFNDLIKVMWSPLVANKILRMRLMDSNNFVADFPNSSDAPSSCQEPLISSKSLFNDPKDTKKYKVFVSTWNVGGVAPPDDLNMEDWLDMHNNSCDIYVLGFQEIVPLNARNILGIEKNRISLMKWNSLIRTALNKIPPISDKNQEAKIGESQRIIYQVKNGNSMESKIQPHQDFRCIMSKHMVGILISVWIRSDLHKYIRHPSASCVGCGIMGFLGNKGSVSVRFFLHETSFCFVCTHLASGGKEGDERHRNSDAAEIFSRTIFPHGSSLNLPRKIVDHDQVIFFGDLNYRISLPETTTRSLVEKKEWGILLQNDQLKVELMEGKVFEGWREGIIEFAPTYKYYQNSDIYYGYVQNKKGEKTRVPAWCDRILWLGKGLKQNQYIGGESRMSDHRPVRAIFTSDQRDLKNSKRIQKCFLVE